MSQRSKTVGLRTYSGSRHRSERQVNGDAARDEASDVAVEFQRKSDGFLTPDEVDQQIRRLFESGQT